MVSKASEDLPEPLTPVTIVRALWGISKSMFLRLWTRTPRTTMLSVPVRFIAVVINESLYNWPKSFRENPHDSSGPFVRGTRFGSFAGRRSKEMDSAMDPRRKARLAGGLVERDRHAFGTASRPCK